MGKRFIDTNIWDKKWFRQLRPEHKCAFLYLLGKCDNVGVWDVDQEAADFMIGQGIDWDMLITECNGNIKILNDRKWFLTDFCAFQYGVLREESRSPAIQSHIKLLKKHSLWEGYYRGTGTPKEKEKDKDKVKVKDNEKEKKETYGTAVTMTAEQHGNLVDKYGAGTTKVFVEKLSVYKQEKGKTYKSDYHAILNWVVDAVGAQPVVSAKGWTCKHCGKLNNHTGGFCLSCHEDK